MINLIVLYSLSEIRSLLYNCGRERGLCKMNFLPSSQFVHINYVAFALSGSSGVVLLIHHCLMHKLLMCICGRFKFRVVKDKALRSTCMF
jgi:hypothetical protein